MGTTACRFPASKAVCQQTTQLRTTGDHGNDRLMRCYYVLVHGKLDWNVAPPTEGEVYQPEGFYCHRFVLASGGESAGKIAFERVRTNLDRSGRWLSDGSATLTLEAEEVRSAPLHKLIKPDNRGHTFY